MMKRVWVLVLFATLALSVVLPRSGAHASVPAKKHCVTKTVKTKVHGKTVKTKKKVCTAVKATPKPKPTATSTATETATPTATATPTNTPVPKTIDPLRFALPLSAFPAGSTVQTTQVEPNGNVRVDLAVLHYTAYTGRLTGYLMEVFQLDNDSNIGYLVSIFGSASDAQTAWKEQHAGWQRYDPTATCPAIGLGDPSFACSNGGIDQGTYEGEVYFVRGRVLIQVGMWVGSEHPDATQDKATALQPAAHRVGAALDSIAAAAQ